MSGPLISPAFARREFLRGAARYLSLSVILGVVAWASGNSRRKSDPTRCRRNFICGGCPLFAGCTLPQAVENRRTEKAQ